MSTANITNPNEYIPGGSKNSKIIKYASVTKYVNAPDFKKKSKDTERADDTDKE
jgi:hypothetical protein